MDVLSVEHLVVGLDALLVAWTAVVTAVMKADD